MEKQHGGQWLMGLGRREGMWSAKEQGARSCWTSSAFLAKTFESNSDGGCLATMDSGFRPEQLWWKWVDE